MKTVLTVLFALALASLSVAQDTSKPVDYVARALPLHQVLLDLEKKSGVHLDCDPAMDYEPLILKLNHVPLQEALDKIALVFAADWVKHDNVLRLETSPAKVEALHRELFEKQVARVKKTLDSLKKRMDEHPPIDADSAPKVLNELLQLAQANQENSTLDSRIKLLEQGSRLPSTRLGVRILSQLDPAELVGLSEGGRFVYASNANSAQHQLPEISPSALEEWRASRKAINSAYEQLPNKPKGESYEAEEIARDRQTDDRLPARILVISPNRPTILPVYLAVILYDQEGRILALDDESLGTGLRETYAFRQDLDEARKKARQTGFELGPIGRELAPRIGANRANLRPLPQFVIDALSHPTKQDPLAFAASDIILTSADMEGANAIALLDDGADRLAQSSARTGKTSLDIFKALLEREDASRVSLEDNWIVVRPTEPIKVQADRAPRSVLEQLFVDDRNQGYLTIEQVADAALHSSTQGLNYMQSAVETVLDSNGATPTYSDRNALWLFATLTPAQREKATAKGGFDLNGPAISPEQIAVAKEFLFHGESTLEGVEPPLQGFKAGDYYPEPEKTDYFPDGVTSDCVLNFSITNESVTFQEESYGDGMEGIRFWSPLDSSMAPSAIAMALHPELFPARSDRFNLTRLQKGTKRTLTVRLAKGKVSISASASEQHLGSGESMTAQQYLDSLPDAQRIKLERQIEEFIKRVQKGREAAGQAPPAPETQKPPVRF